MKTQQFRSLTTIESSFSFLRFVMFGVILACIALSGFAIYWSVDAVNKSRNKVYVMEKGHSLMLALSQDNNVNRSAEAKDHIKTFIKLLFELEPDERQIDKSIDEATYLGNKQSVLRLYTDLKEKNYYNQLVQGDVHQKVEIDIANIEVNTMKSPYAFRARGKQVLIRASSLTVRNLVMEGFLIDATRTDRNAHGFVVEKFQVVDNKDIETVSREAQKTNL